MMDPSDTHNEKDQTRPRPMRAARLKRLLLGTTGIVIVAAGTPCRLVDQEQITTLGVPEETAAKWVGDAPTDWDDYINQW